jgi:hypothetical protein
MKVAAFVESIAASHSYQCGLGVSLSGSVCLSVQHEYTLQTHTHPFTNTLTLSRIPAILELMGTAFRRGTGCAMFNIAKQDVFSHKRIVQNLSVI